MTPVVHTGRSPFSLLTHLAGDQEQLEIFSGRSSVEGWLAAERALAWAQAEHGVISDSDADAIARVAVVDTIDPEVLWKTARNVGYPILGLVREVAAALPPGPDGRVHYGATTQDIMDTGLALQMARSMVALDRRLSLLGDALAEQVAEHARTVMAARTHAQQAVPTTFGATLGALLAQFTRQRERLAQAAPRIAVISLFGAGGTAAALGPHSAEVRASMARRLGLFHTDVPWHVDRDGVAEFGWLCTTITATCARLARNVVDLSRTEIGEVFEPFESHRGASSTMPQKVNPISSEIVIGLTGTAGALASSLARLQEAGHERAAGEWQIEWQVVPQLAVLAGTALSETLLVVQGMRVDAERMRVNLEQDGGLVMAEAQMISLAGAMGREHAHDLVYEASARARRTGRTLAEVLAEVADEQGRRELLPDPPVTADDYVGEAGRIADAAVRGWSATTALDLAAAPLSELAS
ncbi:class-II fumarase/aspartase family protein [Streptantibioticus ferralitis]|uniref:Adenylosuccinate lyase family protein n=1 Tax=Streptantibioticus ferralitis TaxID=236510 RepID=A0ABT5YWL5_9ACTN|nr:adenylosuccinate lyase family protein [Streptantibioticus ferralitis]MDF2255981.1 adenylosuccinate lyase family protein [Streptantibioticus ferralitis]